MHKNMAANTQASWNWPIYPVMRKNPTVTIFSPGSGQEGAASNGYNWGHSSLVAPATQAYGVTSRVFGAYASVGDNANWFIHWVADADFTSSDWSY